VKPYNTDLYKPYAYKGQCLQPPLVPNIQSCPIDDKVMLTDGTTKAIPYPKPGFNCNPYGIAAQKNHVLTQCGSGDKPECKGKDIFKTELYKPYTYSGQCMNPPLTPNIESCPIDDKFMLTDGTTKAIPYPKAGYNCNPYGSAAQFSSKKVVDTPDSLVQSRSWGPHELFVSDDTEALSLAQVQGPLYVPFKYPGLPGFDINKIQHCPDFNERFTLSDGKTKGVPYPQAGFNCNPDYGLAQKSGPLYVPYSYPGLKGFDVKKLQHCPDFNDRFTLTDGKTKGIPYPTKGFNCNADYGLA